MFSDIYDCTEFFYQNPTSAELERIETVLEDFDPMHAKALKSPIKTGTPCLCKFNQDKKWYRGKVLSRSRKNKD